MVTSLSQALLLVDGYNIIGAWSSLKETRDRDGLEFARHELVESLINYTAHKGYRTQVIFDAHYQKTPSSHEHYTSHLSVYYTAWAQTADTYIEKICASLFTQTATYPRIIVATSDQAQRLTIQGYGAEWMSAQGLEKEIEITINRRRKQQKTKKHPKGRFLGSCLDARSQQQLAQWRQGIW